MKNFHINKLQEEQNSNKKILSFFSIDGTNFVIKHDDIDQLETIDQAQKSTSMMCLNGRLQKIDKIPLSRQLSIKLKAQSDEKQISVLCDYFEIITNLDITIHQLPVCFKNLKIPVIGILVLDNKPMCLLSGELLFNYLLKI